MSAATCACVVALVVLRCVTAGPTHAVVENADEFQLALRNEDVQTIVLAQSFTVTQQLLENTFPLPVSLTR